MSSYATDGAPTPSAPTGGQEPEAAAPDTVAPDQTAAEDTGPEEEAGLDDAGLDDAVPDDAVPDDAVPDDAVPDDAVPDDAVPDDAVPWERAPVGKLAIVALVTGVLAIIAAGVVGTVAVLTHGFKKPTTIKYHEASVFKVRQGDCIDTPNGQAVSVLPCATPHHAEVFATFTLPGPAWPGTAAVQQEASSGCATRLSGYLNPQLSISLAQTYVFPNKVSWNAGTRTVVCEVHATSGQLTGSVRGGS